MNSPNSILSLAFLFNIFRSRSFSSGEVPVGILQAENKKTRGQNSFGLACIFIKDLYFEYYMMAKLCPILSSLNIL
jgi:hypothetical protein